jgi:hypothetical protein
MKFFLRKAHSVKKAIRNFDPHKPLWDYREREAFYVRRDSSHLIEIKKLFKRSADYPKILFSGAPGSGKSTELAELSDMLRRTYNVVLTSAKNMTTSMELFPEIFLYIILIRLGNKVRDRNEKFYNERIVPIIKRFQGWESIHTQVDTEGKKFDPATVEKALRGEILVEADIKQEKQTLSKPYRYELICGINDIIKQLEKRRFPLFRRKEVLLLISDLDKIDIESTRNLFFKFFLCLIKINCNAVYTFPLQLKYDTNFVNLHRNFSGIYYLTNFCIYHKHGAINEAGRKKLIEIIERRVKLKIFYKDTLERIINLSGGRLFELINVVHECCIIALGKKIRYIDSDILGEAEERIRENYKIGLTENDLKNLQIVNRDKELQNKPDLIKLLNQYAITEYITDKTIWYDINPILKPLLKEMETAET